MVLSCVAEQGSSAEDAVLVISDHGYGDNPGRRRVLRGYGERIRPPHWHTLDGIIAAAGGPIREGEEIAGATMLDLAPTVLALLGLPVPEDMDGQVLRGLMRERFLSDHPIRWVSSYEGEERAAGEPRSSAYDEGVLDRLRALGCID